MCGIAGLWNTQLPEPATTVGAMLEAMRHRGPDGCGTLEFSGGAAGMVRLALVDLSERGQQPMWSDDRRVAIVFNGEIYNFREERRRLEDAGHRFHSTTDSEVILQLYLERGLDFHERLRGMYALAIFDLRKAAPGGLPQLVLARDPLGIKPLYLAHAKADRQSVVFASEMRGILASGLVRPEICRQSLAGYLGRGFLLQPATMISGVRMLDPGTLECYSPGEAMRSIRFWTMPSAAPRTETLDEAAARLRATLDESVALHAMADAPIGAFLSGGIDSTAIVALMRRRIADLRTYTLRFPDVQGDDEVSEAEAAARKYGCHHTTVDVTAAEVRELLPRFAGELDQPSADGLNTWMISRAAAHDVKGVLSGLGGDEWFSGYPVTRRMAHLSTTFSGRVQTVAGQVASQFAGFVPGGRLRQRVENLAARRSAIALWSQGHTVFRPDVARRMAGIDRARRRDGNGRGARTGWRLGTRDHGRSGVPARYARVHGQPVAARFGRHEHGPFARIARAVRGPGNGQVLADLCRRAQASFRRRRRGALRGKRRQTGVDSRPARRVAARHCHAPKERLCPAVRALDARRAGRPGPRHVQPRGDRTPRSAESRCGTSGPGD